MRRWLTGSAAFLVLAAGFAAWPFFGLYQIGAALHAAEPEAALVRMDVASLRRSLVEQVVSQAAREASVDRELEKLGRTGRQFVLRAAAAEFDRRLAAAITPDTLRRLIVTGELSGELTASLPGSPVTPPASGRGALVGLPENPLRYLRSWRFASPGTFEAVVGEPGRPEDWTGLSMRLDGLTWRLGEITLPPSVLARVQPFIRRRIEELRS